MGDLSDFVNLNNITTIISSYIENNYIKKQIFKYDDIKDKNLVEIINKQLDTAKTIIANNLNSTLKSDIDTLLFFKSFISNDSTEEIVLFDAKGNLHKDHKLKKNVLIIINKHKIALGFLVSENDSVFIPVFTYNYDETNKQFVLTTIDSINIISAYLAYVYNQFKKQETIDEDVKIFDKNSDDAIKSANKILNLLTELKQLQKKLPQLSKCKGIDHAVEKNNSLSTEELHLCTFKTPTSSGNLNDKGVNSLNNSDSTDVPDYKTLFAKSKKSNKKKTRKIKSAPI